MIYSSFDMPMQWDRNMVWYIMYALNLQIAHLSGPEIDLADQLVSAFQINSVVVMSFDIPLLAVVERFLHYLE